MGKIKISNFNIPISYINEIENRSLPWFYLDKVTLEVIPLKHGNFITNDTNNLYGNIIIHEHIITVPTTSNNGSRQLLIKCIDG